MGEVMSKKDKRKRARGPLTPRRKRDSFASITSDELDASPQFFGFNTPSKGAVGAFFDEETPQCMATEVAEDDVKNLAARGVTARPRDWVVSSGSHDSAGGITIHGPFKTM